MRAWAVVENGAPLKELELPTPEPKGTEVLVEVTHCGVCHSDLHIWEGYYDIGGGKKMSLKDRGVVLPLAMGHEIVGRVAKLGPDAKGVKVGDVRIVFPWLGCGTCEKCLAEEDNMCLTPRSLGVYANGGYGTHVIAPHPRHLVDPGSWIRRWRRPTRAPASRSIRRSAKRCRSRPTRPIVVVGAGGLGLNAIAVLRSMKHQNIVVVDISAEKREAALKAGAHKVVDGSGEGAASRSRRPPRRRAPPWPGRRPVAAPLACSRAKAGPARWPAQPRNSNSKNTRYPTRLRRRRCELRERRCPRRRRIGCHTGC